MLRRDFLKISTGVLGSALFHPAWSRTETRIPVPVAATLRNQGFPDTSSYIAKNLKSNSIFEFEAGEHFFSRTLLVPKDMSGVSFIGVSQGTSRLGKSADFPLFRLNGDGNTIDRLTFDGNCRLSDFCPQDRGYGALLLINGSNNIIRNSSFVNSLSNGIHLDGQHSECFNNRIESCVVKLVSGVGLATARARKTSIINNKIEYCGLEALTVDLGGQYFTIEGNQFAWSNKFGGIGTIGYDNCSDIKIIANNFSQGFDSSKAHIRAGNATGPSERIYIERNRFDGEQVAINFRGTSKSTAGTLNVLIAENTFSQANDSLAIKYDQDDSRISIGKNSYK